METPFDGQLPPPQSSTPRPRKGDKLFRNDGPGRLNARVVSGDDLAVAAYAEGYRRGAEVLLQQAASLGESNSLVYPIIFLYRHHLELALKRIVRRAPQLLRRALTAKEIDHLNEHSLEPLWVDVKGMIPDIYRAMLWTALPQIDIDGMDDYFAQLAAVDPSSQGFRYSHLKTGSRSLNKNLTYVNLQNFSELINRLIVSVDDIDTATSLFGEFVEEMEAEYSVYDEVD